MGQRLKKLSIFLILSAFLFGMATVTQAQLGDPNAGDTFGVAQIGENVTLSNDDPREIAGRIINIALGLLGLITVGLILYGGFLYMTSNGSEDKIAEGKKYIINATIGLVIILSAWAIVLFVFKQLNDAIVGDGSGGPTDDSDLPPDSCDPDSPGFNAEQCQDYCKKHPEYSICEDTAFYVKSITPGNLLAAEALTTGMNNIAIRVLFSHSLAADTNLAKSIFVQKAGGTDPLPVTVSLLENNRLLEIFYTPNGSPLPFKEGETYVVTVSKDLKDNGGKALEVDYKSGFGTFPITTHFKADQAFNDTVKPLFDNVNLNGKTGDNLSFAQNSALTIAGGLNDRQVNFGGNSLVKISIASASGGSAIQTVHTAPKISNGSSIPFAFSYTLPLDKKFVAGQKYTVTINGYDIDSNINTASLQFTIKAEHCSNDIKDGDETGVDSGGSCGGGDGDSCEKPEDCAFGFICTAEKVCKPVPVITGLDPLSGAVGNWVSVLGKNFGTAPGKVEFGVDVNKNGSYEAGEWIVVDTVKCATQTSWKDRYVIVSVPQLALGSKAAIRLTTAAGKTDISVGGLAKLVSSKGLFTITDVKKPGLCDVSVSADTVISKDGKEYTLFAGDAFAPPGVNLQAIGSGLGDSAANNKLTFGATIKADETVVGGVIGEIVDNYWTATRVKTRVPANMKAGFVPVHVSVAGKPSNGVPFQVLGTDIVTSVPQISSITPAISTPFSLITIQGKGFGNSTGQIFIASSANTVKTCDTGTPDISCRSLKVTDIASQCGQTWTDTQVIAQLPPAADKIFVDQSLKNFNIIIKTAGPPVQKTVGLETLVIEPGPPGISLCRISPSKGPAPLPVDGAPISIYGVNVPGSDVIDVIYWKKGAVANPNTNTGIEGWLYNLSHKTPEGGKPTLESLPNGTGFTTRLPIDEKGVSMSSGPIRVFDNETGRWSNAVNYTVESCIGSKTALPGYRCCESGSDEGQWKKNNLTCAGETRAAGYTWRFTTGVLANQPRVVEQCNDKDFPSPTPRIKENSNPLTTSCVNATIALRFNMGMDPTTLNKSNIKLFSCANGPGNNIDCETKKTEVDSVDIGYQTGANTLIIREAPPKTNLQPNTWYQVELSNKIKSLEPATILGVAQEIKIPLLATRTCGDGTAYCFSFKTNASECTLVGAGINPNDYTTRNLGILQDPRYPYDSSSVFMPPNTPPNPYYYFLWGKGNQECSVISSQLLDTYSWDWSPKEGGNGGSQAAVHKSPLAGGPGVFGYKNIRALVNAKEHTAPQSVEIKATAVIEADKNTFTDIGGVNILQDANLSVGQTGFAPTAPVTLPQSASDSLGLQNTFALQLKFAQPEKNTFPNNTLIQKVNTSVPGKPYGYVINFINNQICLNPFSGSGASVNLCTTVTPNDNGQYNVVLVGDKSKNTISWVDLVPPNHPVSIIPLTLIPNSGNALAILAADKNPLTAKDPIYFGLQVSGSIPNFLNFSPGVTLTPTSTLTIDLSDPAVTYFEPNCIESCNNASIRVDFNRQMATSTFASGFIVYKCVDGVVCNNTQATSIYTVDLENSTQLTLRANLSPTGPNLEPNQYYKVALNKPNLVIKSIAKVNPIVYGKPLPPTEWVFKTRADAKPCSVGFLQVSPLDLVASAVGQQDKYSVVPYSSPNACSKVGQALNKWAYKYSWNTQNVNVAKISQLPAAQVSNVSQSCTLACLKKGSTIASDSPFKNSPICGNGGLPEAGEDCEIKSANETAGKSCGLNCLRPGNTNAYGPEKTGAGVCGNGQVENNVGEQCDPGNTSGKVKTDNPFCTGACLLRGSKPDTANVPGVAVCGDGEVTVGQETCDSADPNSQIGCTAQCLRKGTQTAISWCMDNIGFVTDLACKSAVSICGNGKLEPNEDCEVGVKVGNDTVTSAMCNKTCQYTDACALTNPPCTKNSPGCSDKCTLLGSKSSYSTPSVCGDKFVGTGENPSCELNTNNGNNNANSIGPTQIVQAVGKAEPATGTTYQQTKVVASTQDNNKTITGQGDYRLQCGYKEFDTPTLDQIYNNCSANTDNNLGVGANSCCVSRPRPINQYPVDGAGFVGSESVCRNSKIEVEFDRAMRIDSINQNVFLITGHTAANFNCANLQGYDFTATVNKIVASAPIPQTGFWAKVWHKVTDWTKNLFGAEAGASTVTNTQEFKAVKTWCANEIPVTVSSQTENLNELETTRVSINISKILDPNTIYGVVLRGDVGGIVDISGVPMKALSGKARNDAWFFKTGANICKIKEVGINPKSHVFISPGTTQVFTAFASSTNGQKIVSTLGYSWTWSFAPNPNNVFDFIQDGSKPAEVLDVRAKTVPGHITAVVTAKVTVDSSAENNQLGQIFNDTFELEALFCKRPWPANPGYPFKDEVYNFKTGYCADAGKAADESDDLPYLWQQDLMSGPISSDSLKKLIFFNDKNSDVIGIQIFGPVKVPLNEWFSQTQKFGSLANFKSEVIGEYSALTDGNNYYVQALNYEPGASTSNSQVNNYIYLFSINPNADPKTREVFNKLLQNISFNINLSNFNFCLVPGGSIRGKPEAINAIQCSTDFDCRDINGSAIADSKGLMSNGTCSNERTKFLRDWKRLNDLRTAQDSIDTYFATQGTGPNFEGAFAGGSFVPGYTVSKWGESWGRLQGLVKNSFSDPLNKWTSCGSADDAQTCWSASSTTYFCPKFKSVYEYEYIESGNTYKLHAPLEFFRTTDQITKDFVDIARFTTQPWTGCASGAFNPFQEKCGDGILNQSEQCDPPGTIELADTKVETTFDRCSQWAESKACKVDNDCGTLLQTSGRYINGIFNVQNGAGVCVGKNGSALTTVRGSDASKRDYQMLSCSSNTECDAFVSSAKAAPGNFNNTHGLLSFHPTADKNAYFPVSPQYQVLNGAPLQQFLADSSNKLTCDTTSFKNTNKYHLVGGSNFCTFNAFNPIIKNNPTLNAKGEYELFACNRNEDCRSVSGSYSQSSGSVSYGVGGITRTNSELNFDLQQNINSLFTCQPANTVLVGDSVRFDAGKSSCSVPTIIPQTCGDGELVKRTCNNQCTWQYGSCATTGSCGNGKVEGAEACDDGALNDTYGHCNAICTGLAVGRCGNGQKDFVDLAKKTLEFCEAGIDGFTSKYNLDRAKSCSWDCRNYGGYCGDGFIQADNGETCDDGNRIGGDSCSTSCKLEKYCSYETEKIRCEDRRDCTTVKVTTGSYPVAIRMRTGLKSLDVPIVDQSKACAYKNNLIYTKPNGNETKIFACETSTDCREAGTYQTEVNAKLNRVYAVGAPTSPMAISEDFSSLVITDFRCMPVDLSVQSGDTPMSCESTNGPSGSGASSGAGPSCGNGITEKIIGEECDTGVNNDKACVPGPNQDSCSYCGNGCKVLTVDQQAYCGNGKVDAAGEICDFTSAGQVVMKDGDDLSKPKICEYMGKYECSNNCTQLGGQCIVCGTTVGQNSGVIPRLNVLNPILPQWNLKPTAWNSIARFYRQQSLDVAGNRTYEAIGFVNVGQATTPSNDFKLLSGSGLMNINSNLACVKNYHILFNQTNLPGATPLTPDNVNSVPATAFSYVPNNEPVGTVQHDVVVSPAVVEGTFRVVMKWASADENLNGSVYNPDFDTADTDIGVVTPPGAQNYLFRSMGGLCETMEYYTNFGWVPTASNNNSCFSSGGVMISRTQSSASTKTHIQTFTIDTKGYPASKGKPYTFFVESLDATAINSHTSLEVLVYEYRPGQNLQYSIYEPKYTFKLNEASAPQGPGTVKYWQVFNLVKDQSTGKYKVENIKGKEANGDLNGVNYTNGLFHRCSEGMYSYLPGEAPVKCS